jgi:hypothetical protein
LIGCVAVWGDPVGVAASETQILEVELMFKRILEFLTLRWLWDRRGGRRR